jgi:hypothetical protein
MQPAIGPARLRGAARQRRGSQRFSADSSHDVVDGQGEASAAVGRAWRRCRTPRDGHSHGRIALSSVARATTSSRAVISAARHSTRSLQLRRRLALDRSALYASSVAAEAGEDRRSARPPTGRRTESTEPRRCHLGSHRARSAGNSQSRRREHGTSGSIRRRRRLCAWLIAQRPGHRRST